MPEIPSAEEIRVRITRAYVEHYLEGACRAILNIWGPERFMQEFGGSTFDEALRNCKEAGRDNAERMAERWVEEYPRKMAYFFLYE